LRAVHSATSPRLADSGSPPVGAASKEEGSLLTGPPQASRR
jgi:hypothetical protein